MLDCVNATRDYVQGRALVVGGATCTASVLADTEVPLNSMVAAGPAVI